MRAVFRDYTFTWWHMGVFKIALLAIGAIAGAYGASFVMSFLWVFIVLAAVASAFIIIASFMGRNALQK